MNHLYSTIRKATRRKATSSNGSDNLEETMNNAITLLHILLSKD